jgi:recombination protein RecA
MAKETTATFDDYITKTYGAGLVGMASVKIDRPRKILTTALSMDIALSGGIPEGISVLLSGKPKAGKTSLCLLFIRNAQRVNRPTFYLDVESKLTASLLHTIEGLDLTKLHVVKNSANKPPLSAEQWLDVIERIIKDHPGALIVVDSIAALCTLLELTESTGDRSDMGGVPRLMAQFYRKNLQTIDGNNCILVWISQLMTSRDPKGKKLVEKGGMAVQYFVSEIINVEYTKLWELDADAQAPLGHDIHFRIVHSALGRPYLPCSLPLRFGHGIDAVQDLAILAENFGLVSRAGAWIELNDTKQKFQGLGKFVAALRSDPALAQNLDSQIRKMVLPDARQTDERPVGQGQPDVVRAKRGRGKSVKVPRKSG